MIMTRAMGFPLAAALALAACTDAEETSYEVDATDEGGGELIVTEEDPDAVPVELPDTPMTNVPPAEQAGSGEDESANGY